jgi:23S rRNA-/tRNA-specific pseudouridylate synthase
MAIVASGKPARTDVERVASGAGFVALRCTLHSGRTHQIRVHLSAHGLPLVGDRLYGGAPALGMERQALHAACSSSPTRCRRAAALRIRPARRLRSRLGEVGAAALA